MNQSSVETTADKHERGHLLEERVQRIWDSPLESPGFADLPLTLGYQRLDLLFVAELMAIGEVVLTDACDEVAACFEQGVSLVKTNVWQMRIHKDASCHHKVELANHIGRQLVDSFSEPNLLDTLVPARLHGLLIEVRRDIGAMDVGEAALSQLFAKDTWALTDIENVCVACKIQESVINLTIVTIFTFLLADCLNYSLRICVVDRHIESLICVTSHAIVELLDLGRILV